MLHIEILQKTRIYHTKNGCHPNTLLIGDNLYRNLILSAPISAIRKQDGKTTFNGMRVLIVQNTIDLLQVTFLQD